MAQAQAQPPDRLGPGDPGRVSSSRLSSTRHRIVTRVRLARMAPRRRRALRDLHSGAWPSRAPGSASRRAPGLAPPVLVVVHVYYPELWEEIAKRIELIPEEVDLVVTLVEGRADQLAESVTARFPGSVVRIVENRGRDLWPLMQVLDLVPDHDVVLKLHTKRSPQLSFGESWRRELLDGVCGSGEQVRRILALLRGDERIGMVVPPGNVLGREFMGANGPALESLVDRTGLTYEPSRLWFPAGSMFWARADALSPLAALGLSAEDFGDESGAIDGTLPHALERYLGVVVASQGRAVVESTEVPQLLAEGALQV